MGKRISLDAFAATLSEKDEWKTEELLAVIEELSQRKSRAKVWKRLDAVIPADGLAKQARVIITALDIGAKVSLKEWAVLAKNAGLSTTQDPERIVAYYKKDLIELGLIAES